MGIFIRTTIVDSNIKTYNHYKKRGQSRINLNFQNDQRDEWEKNPEQTIRT